MKKIYHKTKTRQEVANEYGISSRTFRRWLKKNDIVLPKRLICPKDLDLIYQTFGYPSAVLKNN